MARWIVFEGGWQTLLPLLVLGGIAAALRRREQAARAQASSYPRATRVECR